MIEVKKIDNFNDLSLFENQWDNLLQNSLNPNIFLSYEWFKTYCHHFQPDKLLFLLAIENSELIGIASLQIIELSYLNFLKFRKVVFISERFSEYCDFILKKGREKEALTLFFDELKKYDFDWIDLLDIPEYSTTPLFIQKLADNKSNFDFSFRITDHSINYNIDTSLPKEKYEANFSEKTLKTLKRKTKKLETDFSIKIENAISLDIESFEKLSHFNIRRMDKKLSNSFFSIKRNGLFINDLITGFAGKGYNLISKIYLNNFLSSVFVCFLFNKKISYFLAGSDPSFEKYSLGTVHLKYLIDFCFENKFSSFDFLRGDDEYKKRWHPKKSYSRRIILVKKNLRKRSLNFIFNIFSFMNSLFRKK